MKTYLVTGAAGFIASKTTEFLLRNKCKVIGIDNLNDYYDVALKKYRLKKLKENANFTFHKVDIESLSGLKRIFNKNQFCAVINLAARAGVRYSLENPFIYYSTNTLGTLNLLECCKDYNVKKFLMASTSSLYAGQEMPFTEDLPVNEPISPYAASKKGAEATCYSYHFLYGIDVSILRYFTVYGPAGRPDMSIFRFIKWIDEGKPIELFGNGSQLRDFTYVDDIAKGTIKALKKTKFEIFNLGGNKPYELNYAIELICKYLNKQVRRKQMSFHKADLKATWANIEKAKNVLSWKPIIDLEKGIKNSVEWYLQNKKWLSKVVL